MAAVMLLDFVAIVIMWITETGINYLPAFLPKVCTTEDLSTWMFPYLTIAASQVHHCVCVCVFMFVCDVDRVITLTIKRCMELNYNLGKYKLASLVGGKKENCA